MGKVWSLAACLAFFCAIVLSAAPSAKAAPLDTARCTDLKSLNLTDYPDAPTSIVSAVIVPASKDQSGTYTPESFTGTPIAGQTIERPQDIPSYCQIIGYVAPQVKFELRLPVDGWNSRFLMQGCGGMCGNISMEACEDALVRDYAVAYTDMGHAGPQTTTWAINDIGAKLDFGYRATHETAVIAKVLLEHYYGRPQHYSYFRGCSTGGRQAMIEAQRFPNDFNGIIAGAAVIDESGDGLFHLAWSARASLDKDGNTLIDANKVPMIHKAVMDACDAIDGVKDGVIQDPRKCHWDPASIACKGVNGPNCLTDAEVGVVNKIYAGAHDDKGRRLFPGGMSRGSEYEWVPLFIGTSGDAKGWTKSSRPVWVSDTVASLFRYVFLPRDPGPSFSMLTADFEKTAESLRLVEPIYSARNPDLRAFKEHGGKLLQYHGWDDAEVPPNLSIDYYETVTRTMGGPDSTLDFYRLFMIPGMAHCRRGAGTDTADYLAAIEDWVEKGKAPDSLTAYHLKKPQNYMGLPTIRYPIAQADYAWTRPIFPYPDAAVWSGKGDPNLAESWIRAPRD